MPGSKAINGAYWSISGDLAITPKKRPLNTRSVGEKLLEEFKKLLPVWLFFFISFSLLKLTQTVLLKEYHLRSKDPTEVFVGSLIVAKALLLADVFPFVRRFDNRPALYGALWKTWIYTIVAVVLRYAESLFRVRHLGLAVGNAEAWARVQTPRFWVIQAWLILLLFVFCATREVIRKVGMARFREVMFGSRPKA